MRGPGAKRSNLVPRRGIFPSTIWNTNPNADVEAMSPQQGRTPVGKTRFRAECCNGLCTCSRARDEREETIAWRVGQ